MPPFAHWSTISTAKGHKPYFVPYGVSNALGAIGYATTICEIEQQAAQLGFRAGSDRCVPAPAAPAREAGLVVGAAIAMPDTRIVGIDIDAEPARVRADVVTFAREASAVLDAPFDEGAVEVVAGHAGPAYGVSHERHDRGDPACGPAPRRWRSIRSTPARVWRPDRADPSGALAQG